MAIPSQISLNNGTHTSMFLSEDGEEEKSLSGILETEIGRATERKHKSAKE